MLNNIDDYSECEICGHYENCNYFMNEGTH